MNNDIQMSAWKNMPNINASFLTPKSKDETVTSDASDVAYQTFQNIQAEAESKSSRGSESYADNASLTRVVNLTRPNGGKYTGQVNNEGQPHGEGFEILIEHGWKEIRKGEWKNGLLHGHGEFISGGISMYEGIWKEGKENGRNELTDSIFNQDYCETYFEDGNEVCCCHSELGCVCCSSFCVIL